MAKHAMRQSTVDRPAVKAAGQPGNFYRFAFGEMIAGLTVQHVGCSTVPVTHEWERECTVNRPLVFITGAGRLGRMTKGNDGFHRVEFDAMAVANA